MLNLHERLLWEGAWLKSFRTPSLAKYSSSKWNPKMCHICPQSPLLGTHFHFNLRNSTANKGKYWTLGLMERKSMNTKPCWQRKLTAYKTLITTDSSLRSEAGPHWGIQSYTSWRGQLHNTSRHTGLAVKLFGELRRILRVLMEFMSCIVTSVSPPKHSRQGE